MEDNKEEITPKKNGLFSFFNFFKRDKTKQKSVFNKWAIIISCVLFLVILIIFFDSFKSKNKTENPIIEANCEGISSYSENTEKRLSSIINSISGISNAKVYLSFTNSPEVVYAEDFSENSNNGSIIKTSSIVFSKSGTQTMPIIVKTNYPKINGVLVVAKGVSNAKTKLMLNSCLSAVLGVPVANIEILEGK